MAKIYTRIYADANGVSHFEDVDVDFETVDYAPPSPPLDVSEMQSVTGYAFLRAPAGWSGEWHPAPYRQLHFYLSGEVEAQVSDGEVRRFSAGSAVLLEDLSCKGHRSRTIGSSDVLLAIIRMADESAPKT